jgi:hypothetical protein
MKLNLTKRAGRTLNAAKALPMFVNRLIASCSSGKFVINYRYSIQNGRLITGGGYMCSKSFLARLEMYFKAKDKASREEKAELPLNPQHEGSELDSPIAEDSKMEDVKSRS